MSFFLSSFPSCLGTIPEDPTKYHNFDFIYPIGFSSKRKFYGIRDGSEKHYYTCKILDGGSQGPIVSHIVSDSTLV